MGGRKRHSADDGPDVERKKFKKAAVARGQMLDTEVRRPYENADLLDAETIREEMLLLGLVTGVKSTFLELSLPGFLTGQVPLNNISDPFTKRLKDFATNNDLEEPSFSFIKAGMIFPCKVTKISRDPAKKRPSIMLSINPADINGDLWPVFLFRKMVLYVSISSVEDHGCVVDVGNKKIKGFLPKKYYQASRSRFEIGEVIPTSVEQMNFVETSVRIELSPLDFKTRSFPPIPNKGIVLSSILPGMRIQADVVDVKHPFLYLKYEYFDIRASILSIGPSYRDINIGSTVLGTVLYVHPITSVVYLSVDLNPIPGHFEYDFLPFKKYAAVNSLTYFSSYKKFVYYVIRNICLGFFHVNDLPKCTSNETVKARVVGCHYMDNLVQLSANPSLLEKYIIFPVDVRIGDKYEATVSKHVEDGMFVQICPGLSGFVRRIHMSDVLVTKPEVLYPLGTKVNCRVLSTDGEGKLNLTCKESLLNLHHQFILSSYENVQKGQHYKGVIVRRSDLYILIAFFNDVKGIVFSPYIPKGSIFFEGQTVLCKVLYCNSLKKTLKLSLQVEERYPIGKIDASCCESSEKVANDRSEAFNQTGESVHHQNVTDNSVDSNNLSKTNNSLLTFDQSLSLSNEELGPGANAVTAVIQSIKGNQLNVIFNQTKGRVHITELGCAIENIYPLKDFRIGQEIQVYVVGDFMKKKKNFLEVSHQNFFPFKECSLQLTPWSMCNDFYPGKKLMGFVKEVNDVSILLWLTPFQIGVLDHLHFSENLKIIKSIRRRVKVGLSIKVTVVQNDGSTVILTKTSKQLPQPGRNVIGLVQAPYSEHGLPFKLPFGYHGSVALTDLTDEYYQIQSLIKKYSKLMYAKCHILEVNHETKYCQLSLRKSRMYGIANESDFLYCPEVSEEDIEEGNTVIGLVKSVSDSAVVVNLGRKLNGTVTVHKECQTHDCQTCKFSKKMVDEYPVRSIILVTITKCLKDTILCEVKACASESLENDDSERLNVQEDVSWDTE